MTDLTIIPPMLTADLPGIGGRIKTEPEDFEVEEIPAYRPCGSGDFLYLWIEKRAMGAEYFIREVARRLGTTEHDVGSAGLKDRHAVTRQMISVPAGVEDRLADLDGDGIRLLQIGKHTNKLKQGHLHGNRFRILIREEKSSNTVEEQLTAIIQKLHEHGMPNFYGEQRFGHDYFTLKAGMAILLGEALPNRADGKKANPRNKFFRKFALSAVQSALFNLYLARRMEDGLLRKVISGDVMCKWPAGGMFVAADVETEQQRFDARETVSAGPIFGRKTFAAAAEAATREAAVLAHAGLSHQSFDGFGKLLMGTRRHNLIYIDDFAFHLEPEGVRLSFRLPAGSYATVLLREIMKTNAIDQQEDES